MQAAALALLALVALSACASPGGGGTERSDCFPGRLTIADPEVAPGGRLRIESERVDCDIRFTGEQSYRLVVGRAWEPEEYYVDVEVPVEDDGHFAVTLDLPPDMPTGEAFVMVAEGYEFDCDDTGSCAFPMASFTVT